MTVIGVVGLTREARIVQGPGVVISRRGLYLTDLIAKGASGIISIGIAAALDPVLKVGDCVIASSVSTAAGETFPCARAWSDALANKIKAHAGMIAASDQVIASAQDKARLHEQTGAIAADMESHIAARAARAANIQFAALRIISDRAQDALPPAAVAAMRADGSIDIGTVIGSLIAKPTQVGALMKAARDAEIAFRELLRCRRLLGPGLACPYLGELLGDMR